MDRRVSLAALMLATFTVSTSFGLVLPIAPQLVRAASPASSAVALHAGGLTAIYMFAIAVFAPLWGRLSDHSGRRVVLIIGLLGFAFSMAAFAGVRSLPQLYLERFASGLFAAAISPVAAAVVSDIAPTDQWRASRMAWLNMASIFGFVLGPSLSVWAVRLQGPARDIHPLIGVPPFAGAALLALIAAAWVLIALGRRSTLPAEDQSTTNRRDSPLTGPLLSLTFAAAAILGAFEVGVSLRGGRLAGASQSEIAAMFAVCSLVMFIAQAALFSPLVRAERTWRFLAPSFGLLAVGLLLASIVTGPPSEMAVAGLVAATSGVISPTLAYWLTVHAGKHQGSKLGWQMAATSLGQAAGSAGGGWLMSLPGKGDPFLWSAPIAVLSAAAALVIAPRLVALPSDWGRQRAPKV